MRRALFARFRVSAFPRFRVSGIGWVDVDSIAVHCYKAPAQNRFFGCARTESSMMARPKKKTLSQNVVNAATTGMPSPVRSVLGNRIIALLVVLALPILYMLGVVSIDWENGRPHLSVDRKKAAEVKEKASERIHEIQEQRDRDQNGRPHLLSQGESTNPLADRMAKALDSAEESKKQSFGFAPAANEPEAPAGQKPRPGARLKKLFDDRR